jgi:hypothetical protein
VRACVCGTLSHCTTLCRVPDVAEQQQPPQVAVAHHLRAHPGWPGHDAHAAGWAPLTSAAALVKLPAWACMSTPLTSAEEEHGRLNMGSLRAMSQYNASRSQVDACSSVQLQGRSTGATRGSSCRWWGRARWASRCSPPASWAWSSPSRWRLQLHLIAHERPSCQQWPSWQGCGAHGST